MARKFDDSWFLLLVKHTSDRAYTWTSSLYKMTETAKKFAVDSTTKLNNVRYSALIMISLRRVVTCKMKHLRNICKNVLVNICKNVLVFYFIHATTVKHWQKNCKNVLEVGTCKIKH